jgi:hypothetical protein
MSTKRVPIAAILLSSAQSIPVLPKIETEVIAIFEAALTCALYRGVPRHLTRCPLHFHQASRQWVNGSEINSALESFCGRYGEPHCQCCRCDPAHVDRSPSRLPLRISSCSRCHQRPSLTQPTRASPEHVFFKVLPAHQVPMSRLLPRQVPYTPGRSCSPTLWQPRHLQLLSLSISRALTSQGLKPRR